MEIQPKAAILVKVATSLAADIRVSDEGMMASHQMSLLKHFHSDINYIKIFGTKLLSNFLDFSSTCIKADSAVPKELGHFISNQYQW